jgi:hypothetical protein
MSSPTADPAQRSWFVSANIPAAHADAVMKSCMGGIPDLTLSGPHANVLLCALPKSASLHVTQLLAHSLGLANVPVGFDKRGGRSYYPRLVLAKYAGGPTISHCHNPPDPFTRKVVERMGFRPVVLTRNLLDALVSRRDMSVDSPAATGILSPRAFQRFLDAPEERQLDVTIDLYAPTYINFAASWREHAGDPSLRPIFATFDEMKRDEVAMVERIAAELGLSFDRARTKETSEKIRAAGGVHVSPRGKGRSGRGRASLSPAQIERLRAMAIAFGCSDEAFLGFPLEPATSAAA